MQNSRILIYIYEGNDDEIIYTYFSESKLVCGLFQDDSNDMQGRCGLIRSVAPADEELPKSSAKLNSSLNDTPTSIKFYQTYINLHRW